MQQQFVICGKFGRIVGKMPLKHCWGDEKNEFQMDSQSRTISSAPESDTPRDGADRTSDDLGPEKTQAQSKGSMSKTQGNAQSRT